MARSRMIKPDFWDDEKLSTICRDARLTFIGLWNHSDDYGVVKGHHGWLKSKIYPYDNITHGVFSEWLKQLQNMRAIIPFEANGEKFYFIRKFKDHQKVNRPSKQRNPTPPDDILEGSLNDQGVITDETETETETETEKKDRSPSGQPSADFPNPKSKHFENLVGEYFKNIKSHCETIFKFKGLNGFNPFEMVQMFCNQKKHPGAIEYVMKALANEKYFTGIETNVYRYANGMMKTQNQNFNERDSIRIHEKLKGMNIDALKKFTHGLLKEV